MNLVEAAKLKIRGRNLKLMIPEGDDPRMQDAAAQIEREQLAQPVVYLAAVPRPDIVHIRTVQRQRPKMSDGMAERLLEKSLVRAAAAVAVGDAHALLAGAMNPTAKVIEAALLTIGLAPGITMPSSYFLMQWPERKLILADCAVNADPSAEELASIAIATYLSAKAVLHEEPRIAMLSFSTDGSAKHPRVEKVVEALKKVQIQRPEILIDGEFQLDAALSPEVAGRKVKRPSLVAGQANVLIFPDLDAGNIAYKTAQYLGGARAAGPVLQGFAKPVSDLSRGATVGDIVDTAALLLAGAVRD